MTRDKLFMILMWAAVALIIVGSLFLTLNSPLIQYREMAYIVSGLAGAFALAILLVQPLLAAGFVPKIVVLKAKKIHRIMGSALIIMIGIHVGGLYLTSPPDTVDALLLVSPTPFSIYGVTAMWAAIITALLVALRGALKMPPQRWRIIHTTLTFIIVIASVVHALMIQGAMELYSKLALSIAAIAAMGFSIFYLRVFRAELSCVKKQNSRLF